MEIVVTGASQGNSNVARFLEAIERGGAICEPLRKVRRQMTDYVTNYKNRAVQLQQVQADLANYDIEALQKLVFDLNGKRENEVVNELKKLQSAFLDIVGVDVKQFLKSDVIRDQAFYDWVDGNDNLSELLNLMVPGDVNQVKAQIDELRTKLGDLPETVDASGTIPNKTRSDLKCLRDCKYRWEEESQLLDSYLNTLSDVSVIFVIIGEMKTRLEKKKQQASIDAYEVLNR